MIQRVSPRRILKAGLASGLALLILSGCGNSRQPSADELLREQSCPVSRTNKEFEETPFVGGTAVILSFQNIRASLNSSCAGCHQAPAKSGGFSYIDEWQGHDALIGGETRFYPGFSDAAEKIRDAIFNPDESKRMPPSDRRSKNPEAYLEIGRQLQKWIDAGKPNGTFKLGAAPEAPRGKPRPQKPHTTSEIGDCVPAKAEIGVDSTLDRQFETAAELPKYLSETDLYTLDPFALAQTGTVAYNVEYPLWADNADKGRWVHVPTKIEKGRVVRQAIEFDSTTKQFKIPDHTRFYKTFYRAVKLPNGKTRMRRMETRLIVTRTPWEKSLFGTYQWDETEQIASLVDAPYRDGSPWKDLVFDVVVDEAKNKLRPYAIPGRQRCVDCHQGSPTQNFVLGFQPLQINKRPLGGAGRETAPGEHDLDQVERFLSYGVLKGIRDASELPVLENAGALPAHNVYELRANAYTVGNCYHCHNPKGLAFTKENGIQLALGPGDIFGFNTQQKSVQISSRRLVHQNGELEGSQIWRKVSDSATQQGMFSQMPMHTPGGPDCNVLRVMGKWIRSFENDYEAEIFEPACKKENPFFWIDMDFTWVQSEFYTPRRADWKDPVEGMPPKYRDIRLSPALEAAITTEYPVGYWLKKPVCKFPKVDLPPEQRRPWMMRGAQPKRPFGEVYYTTPGSYFFRNTCMKCHGPQANGDSALAKGILNWSGGSVRVANLIDGMFGKKGENLKTFDVDGRNLAGNYLIWMAMEGTRVRFPPEVANFMGKHGGQMLNGIREKCLAQISTDKPSSKLFMDHEIFNKVCFMDNLEPGHPDLAFDPESNKPLHPDAVEAWLDRGAWNAGWALYGFLKEAGEGRWRPGIDQCENVYSGGTK